MVASLIAGAENLIDDRIAYANSQGLSHRVGATYRAPSSPWRFVGHTIEAPPPPGGWSLSTLRGAAIRHRTPPHLWGSPGHDWVGQTVPLDLSAYALRHEAGDPETNHAHAIQLELLGFAADDPYTEHAEWIGRRVLRPILDAGVTINVGLWAPSDGSAAYGEDGTVRMSWAAWAGFNGVCGHQNVPGNSHWDPGRARYDLIAGAAGGTEPKEWDEMASQDEIRAVVRDEVAGVPLRTYKLFMDELSNPSSELSQAVVSRAASGTNKAHLDEGSRTDRRLDQVAADVRSAVENLLDPPA